mgnify:CR=1 FL=1
MLSFVTNALVITTQRYLSFYHGKKNIDQVGLVFSNSMLLHFFVGLLVVGGLCAFGPWVTQDFLNIEVARKSAALFVYYAAVVMLFDERGQADTFERKIEVAERAYKILTEEGFPAEDIIFDPNILAVATGIEAHDSYAIDFIRATEWIRTHLPGAHVSGGVSNLSFAFRGNNYLREAMHAVFLFEGMRRGMDFAIVNPSAKVAYADIPQEHLAIIEEVLLRPSSEASEALIELATALNAQAQKAVSDSPASASVDMVQMMPVEERLAHKLQKGTTDGLEADLNEALLKYPRAVDIIEGPLMEGMNRVGQLFGEGKMFLPQVVKTARTMKRAVGILQPYIEGQKAEGQKSAGKLLLATVKGDVHDIGKNIVSVVMGCNGYEVVDLGVMVPPEDIVRAALEHKPDVIGLSGLITPSLAEMTETVRMLAQAGISVPVMIGGATTSAQHTALKISPVYEGPVIWVKDASQNCPVASRFLNEKTASQAMQSLREEQEALRRSFAPEPLSSLDEARKNKPRYY